MRSLELLVQKIQLSFDVCYIIESVRGLVVLLRCSRLLESSFLPRSIENGWLLQYGHAYQLSVLANVNTRTCVLLCIYAYCGTVRKRKCYATQRSCKQNGTLTFYWLLLYVNGYVVCESSFIFSCPLNQNVSIQSSQCTHLLGKRL